jgi:hypothetical protein
MEMQHTSGLSRRRLMQLGALSVGGVLAASVNGSASAATGGTGPGQDGATRDAPRAGAAARTPAVAGTAVAKSYNGWVVGKTAAAIGVRSYVVAGTAISIAVRSGDVATVLMYLAARFNTEVQKLRAGQIWGYEYRADANNSKWWSCHASGTAVDLNAVLHPNHARGTFTAVQVRSLRNILADCGGVIYWGGDYSGVCDEMHFEINVPPGDPRLAALAARIRGVAPVHTPPPVQTRHSVVLALRAGVNHRFVTADIRGAHPLVADRTVIGGAEQFEIVAVDAGHIALRARANNRFVSADRAGRAPLIANRSRVGTWERFTLVHNTDGSVSLRAAINGRYVTAAGGGTQALIANRTAIGSGERFTVTAF